MIRAALSVMAALIVPRQSGDRGAALLRVGEDVDQGRPSRVRGPVQRGGQLGQSVDHLAVAAEGSGEVVVLGGAELRAEDAVLAEAAALPIADLSPAGVVGH